jgi:hypothetical protein
VVKRVAATLPRLLALAGLAVLAAWLLFAWNRARQGPAGLAVPSPVELPLGPEPGAEGRESPALDVPLPLPADTTTAQAGPAPARTGSDSEQRLECAASVAHAGGLPAAGASIFWFDSQTLASAHWQADLDEWGMSREFLERNGRRFVTDDAGVASIPADPGRVQLVAVTQDSFGMLTLDGGTGPGQVVRVELRPAVAIPVRVIGARTGEPLAGVPVAAECTLLPGSRVAARTDARGQATLWPLFPGGDGRFVWRVVPVGIFREELRAPLSIEPRAEPLELRLPDCAPVSVRVVDEKGALRDVSGRLSVGWNDADGDPREPRSAPLRAGSVNLGHVETNLTLYVRAQPAGERESDIAVFEHTRSGSVRSVFDLRIPAPKPEREP